MVEAGPVDPTGDLRRLFLQAVRYLQGQSVGMASDQFAQRAVALAADRVHPPHKTKKSPYNSLGVVACLAESGRGHGDSFMEL